MEVDFITGASSGIGRSLAKRLAVDGGAVVVVARRKELLDSLVQEIEVAGGRALAIACDVTDSKAIDAAARTAEEHFGPITRIVANAGASDATDAMNFEAGHVASLFQLNVLGVANCIAAVLPGMLARGSGHLVAMSSLAGQRGLPSAAAYGATKAAVTNMMEGLRIDLRPRGIDVTVLAPGFVNTKQKKKSKKSRPFRLELEDATERVHRAILARKPYYAFPKSLVALLRLTNLLPARLYDRVVRGRGPKPKKRP